MRISQVEILAYAKKKGPETKIMEIYYFFIITLRIYYCRFMLPRAVLTQCEIILCTCRSSGWQRCKISLEILVQNLEPEAQKCVETPGGDTGDGRQSQISLSARCCPHMACPHPRHGMHEEPLQYLIFCFLFMNPLGKVLRF